MKTINQVLLALIFVAFSTAGFAQSQTTWPQSGDKRVDDKRYKYIDVEDEDEEDDNEDATDISEEELNFILELPPRQRKAIIYEGESDFMLNQM